MLSRVQSVFKYMRLTQAYMYRNKLGHLEHKEITGPCADQFLFLCLYMNFAQT